MLYMVWVARNKRVFENKVSNCTTICDEVQMLSFFWITSIEQKELSLHGFNVFGPVMACKFPFSECLNFLLYL